MNDLLGAGIPAFTVFLQGLLSFFAPCVLPLVPLYAGYLAGGTKEVGADGALRYPPKKILVNTLFFVLGISFAFFLLGFGFTSLGRLFTGNRQFFSIASGIIMILFGLYQLGVFRHARALDQEHRLPLHLERFAMGPVAALLLGFSFSFAWTPCVGPALGGVLLMVSSSGSAAMGYLLIGVYTLGFVIPFLCMGLFTGTVLRFFRKYQSVVRYTVKAGAVLLLLMGILTLTGLSGGAGGGVSGNGAGQGGGASSTEHAVNAPDFTLTDQNGDPRTLSDYKGKTVVLTFWATWCTYCKKELPELQELYEQHGENGKDLVILGAANPKSADYPKNYDEEEPVIKGFLEEQGITFPVVMDVTGSLMGQYEVPCFPTTVIIGKDGSILRRHPGAITRSALEELIKQDMQA